MADGNLTLATAWSEEVEDIYFQMGDTIQQAKETLRQAQNNQENYNTYQVMTQTATAAARLARDNQRIRTLALREATTVIIV